jgi:hypothetical protein
MNGLSKILIAAGLRRRDADSAQKQASKQDCGNKIAMLQCGSSLFVHDI